MSDKGHLVRIHTEEGERLLESIHHGQLNLTSWRFGGKEWEVVGIHEPFNPVNQTEYYKVIVKEKQA